jgi:aquaporin Z
VWYVRAPTSGKERRLTKYATEMIGTFVLVLTIGCTVLAGRTGVIAPLAIGSALMAMVFAGGHLSGAHYNPAVTLAVWLRGKCAAADVAPYWAAQIAGAVLAAVVVGFLRSDAEVTAITIDTGRALVAELLFTFALVHVVLNVTTAKGTSGNSFYGLAIGMTVMVGAFAVSDISGAVFNPAVAVGAAVMGLVSWSSLWLYLIADLLGAAAAAATFKALNPADR